MSSIIPHQYEGAEKLLEICFFNDGNAQSVRSDLRVITRKQIDDVLNVANCTIIKEHRNKHQLSYVLSESSLFITKNRIILKTCGNTRLLSTLNSLYQLARELGFMHHSTYYSRCSFLFPKMQELVYQNFTSEVDILRKYCEGGSEEFTFGPQGGNQWNFYCGHSQCQSLNEPSGQTLELMMRGLNQDKMEVFYEENSVSGEEATRRSGILNLFPGANIADHLFEYCGYSANGLMQNDEYFTIHVTPQAEFSYASFETNVAMKDYKELILAVLEIFQPATFIASFVSDSKSNSHHNHKLLKEADKLGSSFERTGFQNKELWSGREVTYAAYRLLESSTCRYQSASDLSGAESPGFQD